MLGRSNAAIDAKQDVSDKAKMSWIEIEFAQSFILNLVNVAHLGGLIYSRGLSFCLWDTLFIGKAFFRASCNILADILGYLEYKVFVYAMTYKLDTFDEPSEEVCPICQDELESGVNLRCGHPYHKFCIIKYL